MHVYRGANIYSYHYLVVAKIALHARWKKLKQRPQNNEEVYKTDLLQEDNTRDFYQKQLSHLLQEKTANNDIELE